MKRILCAMLTAVLVLVLCAPAMAGAYTHPEAGFQLTIPEGWVAVDSVNVEEVINAGGLSAALVATITSIREMLDSTYSVYLFKKDAAQPPFVNIGVEYKGDFDWEISLDDLLVTAQAYEAYYLEEQEQFSGYTVLTPAGSDQMEGWYPIGYLGGAYELSGYQIGLAQVFVAAGVQFYEFTLTAEEDDIDGASDAFSELVGSFIAP